MRTLDFIATGTGRVGTKYVASILTRSGLKCGHEAVFTCFGYGRSMRADSSYQSAPHLLRHPEAAVLHLYRPPDLVVPSLISLGWPPLREHGRYIRRWLPGIFERGDVVAQACEFYVSWNRMVMAHGPDWTARPDAVPWDAIAERLGLDTVRLDRALRKTLPQNRRRADYYPVEVTDEAWSVFAEMESRSKDREPTSGRRAVTPN